MKNITLSSPQTPTWFNPNDRRYYLGFYSARQEVVMSTDFRYDNKTLDQIKAIEGFKRGSYFIAIEDDCTDRAKLVVWSGEDWFIYQNGIEPTADINRLLSKIDPEEPVTMDLYWCVVCQKALSKKDGVVVHDDIPHPAIMDFNEESNPH